MSGIEGNDNMVNYPKLILLFSGKRKSGKDYFTDCLFDKIGAEQSVIIKISAPIKSHWSKQHHLDLNLLLSDGEYKEKHRLDMIRWSEEKRNEDYGFFCKAAVEHFEAETKPVWIVSDIRRKTDIRWFRENYGKSVKTIRIYASEETRIKRGWQFSKGVDDAPSECDLDDVEEWDHNISNNEGESLEDSITQILHWIQQISF